MHATIATMNPNTEAATIAPTMLPMLMLTVFDAAFRNTVFVLSLLELLIVTDEINCRIQCSHETK